VQYSNILAVLELSILLYLQLMWTYVYNSWF